MVQEITRVGQVSYVSPRRDNGEFWGFLESDGERFWFGSRGYRSPSVARGETAFASVRGEPPPLSSRAELIFVPGNGPKGPLAKVWCERRCWQLVTNTLAQVLAAEVERQAAERGVREAARTEEERLLARRRRDKPATLEEALANGWEIHQDSPGQTIVRRPRAENPNQWECLTFHKSKESKHKKSGPRLRLMTG